VGSANTWRLPHHRSAYAAFLREYWDAQTQTYENNGQGWIFWAWKAPQVG
jgi:hypothetical protein